MKLKVYITVLSVGALLLSACGGSKENEAQTDKQDLQNVEPKDTTPITVEDTVLYKFDFAVANIPSPASLIYGIKKGAKPYERGVLNEPSKAQALPSEFQKAVNLGIYNIDMAYAVVNNMGSDVLDFLKAIIVLGDGLGLRNTITGIVGKRAEANLSNTDSLFAVLDDIYEKSDEYLRTNHRVYVASLVFTGSWVEVLYLTTKMNTNSPEAKATMNKMIWEQRFHLGNIIKLLSDHKGDNEHGLLLNDLTELHKMISKVKDVSEMTDANSKEITNKIEALRTRLSN